MKRNARRPNVTVTTGGQRVVAHSGARLLCELADELGLTDALSGAMAPTKRRQRGHDRGRVLVDMAVAIADGATTFSDLRVLADQPQLFGAVASVATTWRTLEATDAAALERIAQVRLTGSPDKGPPLVGVHAQRWEDDHSEAPAPHTRAGRAEAP